MGFFASGGPEAPGDLCDKDGTPNSYCCTILLVRGWACMYLPGKISY
jgi:hypothetical protein